MLNRIKNRIKIYIRNIEFNKIKFDSYLDYKDYFLREDEDSQWDPVAFSKIIEENLGNQNNLTLVEIGVARGGTAKYTINKLNKRVDKYFGVDPYKSKYDNSDMFSYFNQEFMDNCYLYVLDKITDPRFFLIRSESRNACSLFLNNSIDAIYIDGNHTYEAVIEDIDLWKEKIKDQGLIIGDDYLNFEGVRKAVKETFSDFKTSGNTWFVKIQD